MRRLPFLLFLAGAACGRDAPEVPPRPPAAPEPGIASDNWSLLKIFGQEVGYIHTRVTRKGDLIETVLETKMVIKRAGTEMAVEQTDTSEEHADGTLVRFRSNRKMSSVEQATDIRLEGGKATLAVTVMGKTRTSTMDVPADVVGPHRIDERTRAAKPGEKFEAKTFVADVGAPVTLTVTRGAAEEVEMLDGKREKLVRVETLMDVLPLKTTMWLDASGKTRRTLVPVGGFQMETWLVTEERARRALGGGALAPEVFAPTLLEAPHPIPLPRQLDRATYLVRCKGDMPAFADDRQSVEPKGPRTVLLTIERKVPPEGRTGRRPIENPPLDLAPSLAPNSTVQSDAPEIVAIAREVAGDEPDAWKAARKLERWVKENIKRKELDVGFASAAEVMRDRQGDCTEHSVLLCALCRAAGIPARCAMGIVCLGSVWGGHAWNEVWIDGKWYGLDATFGQGSVDPAHITLSRVTLKDAGFGADFVGLVQGLGSIEVDATEVVLDGRTIRMDEATAKIDGDTYENPLWGIRFLRPKGWTFGTPPPGGGPTPLAKVDGASEGTIVVAAIDAAEEDWDSMRRTLEEKRRAVEEIRVDGRPALRLRLEGRDQRVFALGRRGVFIFEASRSTDPLVFDALLESVDFDVK